MTTTNQDFEIYADNDVTMQIKLGTRKADGQPLDLTGAAAAWAAVKESSPGVPATTLPSILKTTAGPDVAVLRNAAGAWVLQVLIADEDTENLPPGGYYHEAKVITVDGKEATVATGRLTIKGTFIRP